MTPIKILLLCSSRLALPALQELAFFNMLAAVVIPRHCDEMVEATRFVLTGTSIPVLVTDRESYVKELKDSIGTYGANLGIMITFSYKIPEQVYSLMQYGFYNVHPGPLPAYRGADPVFQQIKNKEKYAGITIHQLSEQFDTGPVIIKEMIRLSPTDTYGMLTTRLAQTAARITMVLLKLVSLEVTIPSKIQDESKARYYKKQTAEDVTINWQLMDSESIIALTNACNPWNKGASTKINNKIVRILEAQHLATVITPGTIAGTVIAFNDKGLIVCTLNEEAILVCLVHVDEGFISAGRLIDLGVHVGNRFEKI